MSVGILARKPAGGWPLVLPAAARAELHSDDAFPYYAYLYGVVHKGTIPEQGEFHEDSEFQ